MIVKCVVCGKEFEAQKSTKKYCSNECIKAMRRDNRRVKFRGNGGSRT